MANKKCCICGGKFSSHYDGKPYCNKHYQKAKRYGDPNGKARERKSIYIVDGDKLTIITSKGDKFIADAEDIGKISKYSWCKNASGYAVANNGKKILRLNRYVMDVDDSDVVVDHINRDRSDNRKSNLRICTPGENVRNRKHKNDRRGIRLTDCGRYNVRITHEYKEIHIGNFGTFEEALSARKKAEDMYHGTFGRHMSEEVDG